MDIKEYISSGIIEAYLLGTASLQERSEFEKLRLEHTEIQAEFEAVEKAMNEYANIHSIAPPSYLKDNIINQIRKPVGSPENVRLLEQAEKRFSTYFNWAIAASVLLIVSIGFDVYFGMRSNKLDTYLNDMAKINSILTDSLKSISSNNQQIENDLAILKDPMYKIIPLKGMQAAPDAKAMVCWCPMDKKVYLEVDKLPAPPKGMQYQLWAMVDGKPVSDGMISPGSGLHQMESVDNAKAFAITLEKEGGSPVPHGDMYVMGSI
jgi:anti-sigma-K factor RskA